MRAGAESASALMHHRVGSSIASRAAGGRSIACRSAVCQLCPDCVNRTRTSKPPRQRRRRGGPSPGDTHARDTRKKKKPTFSERRRFRRPRRIAIWPIPVAPTPPPRLPHLQLPKSKRGRCFKVGLEPPVPVRVRRRSTLVRIRAAGVVPSRGAWDSCSRPDCFQTSAAVGAFLTTVVVVVWRES